MLERFGNEQFERRYGLLYTTEAQNMCEICAGHNTTKVKDATTQVNSETASVSYQQPASPGGPFCGNLGVS